MPQETNTLKPAPTAPTKVDRAPLPDWLPAWARELAELYFSGTTCVFILHGNVHDLIRCPESDGDSYLNLTDFLTTQIFGSWGIVLKHDLSRGLRTQTSGDTARHREMIQWLVARWGEPANWPRDPDQILPILENLIEGSLMDDAKNRQSIALLFDYAQYLVPAGDLNSLSRGPAGRLVRFLSWAQNPLIKRVNIAFCLVVDKLTEINDRLVQSPYVATIEIPLPDRESREAFALWSAKGGDFSKIADFPPAQLAEMSNGLSLVNLDVVLSQARDERRLDSGRFRDLKKDLIERQCGGLVEFVEPRHTLDLLVGQEDAKKRLADDAKTIAGGQLDTAPMGYLICGAVGTGKSFLAECYAGSIGIPCAVLKNFRSKYVGETEGNLQQVLGVLRSLGPVVVIVDEADAALGNREQEGDSGTSARVFSMIASQMGDTRYRGKILWMLLTSRPDLLPVDLKRQGRAEVHIPLFYPYQEAEIRTMVEVMARKNKLKLAAGAVPTISPDRKLSGADIESVVLAAKRAVLLAGRQEATKADFEVAVSEFIPSSQGLEKEMQEIAAVLECTQLSFLPPHWREEVLKPHGRSALQERMAAIRQLLES